MNSQVYQNEMVRGALEAPWGRAAPHPGHPKMQQTTKQICVL